MAVVKHISDRVGVMYLGKDINFTEGNIIESLVVFSLPIMAGEMLQNLYNSVDSLVVGNYVGDTALAAVGICSILSNMLIGFFNGTSIGSNVVISRAIGKGDLEKVRAAIRYTFTFAVVLGFALSIFGIVLSPILLQVTGANEEIYAEALNYLRIYLAGLMFTVIYNNGAGILRAVGDARTPFVILTISSIANMILDIVFVIVIKMGIVGVGIATVLAQLGSVVMICNRINTKVSGHCIAFRETWKEGKPVIKEAMGIGFAAGLQSALVFLSNAFALRYVNIFSTASVAGFGVGQRIDKTINLLAKSYGLAITTYVGQNIGAGNYDRVKKGIVRCLVLSWVTILFFGALVYPNAATLARLFNGNDSVVDTAVRMIRFTIPFYLIMAVMNILLGVLRGYGKSREPMMISLLGMVVFRQIFLAITMAHAPNMTYVISSYPIGWVTTVIMLVIYAWAKRSELNSDPMEIKE